MGGMMKLGTFLDILDVINHTSFHRRVMNTLRASGGSKRAFPFEMHMALTTLPCASGLASDISAADYPSSPANDANFTTEKLLLTSLTYFST
jgi:hypothetical protein